MTNYPYPPARKPFLARIAPAAGLIALAIVFVSIGWCGVTQRDIHRHKEGWSAVIMIAFILAGLALVGIIPVHKWWGKRK